MALNLMNRCETIPVFQEYHVAVARRAAHRLATEAGFSDADIHYIETSASELACNLWFHATAGGVIEIAWEIAWEIAREVARIEEGGRTGIRLVSRDDGPGIPDLEKAMTDGFSTNGGLGSGLPGVRRLMDEFVIESEVGRGTRVIAKKWRR